MTNIGGIEVLFIAFLCLANLIPLVTLVLVYLVYEKVRCIEEAMRTSSHSSQS